MTTEHSVHTGANYLCIHTDLCDELQERPTGLLMEPLNNQETASYKDFLRGMKSIHSPPQFEILSLFIWSNLEDFHRQPSSKTKSSRCRVNSCWGSTRQPIAWHFFTFYRLMSEHRQMIRGVEMKPETDNQRSWLCFIWKRCSCLKLVSFTIKFTWPPFDSNVTESRSFSSPFSTSTGSYSTVRSVLARNT